MDEAKETEKAPGPKTGWSRADDNWRRRSEKLKCQTCMWYVKKEGLIGRCRRHAPTMNGYPVVYDSDWCGDHKLDEVSGG